VVTLTRKGAFGPADSADWVNGWVVLFLFSSEIGESYSVLQVSSAASAICEARSSGFCDPKSPKWDLFALGHPLTISGVGFGCGLAKPNVVVQFLSTDTGDVFCE
jgi:hypothetical protein